MNKTPAWTNRLASPDPLLFWAYGLPLLYWTYLTLTTNFILVFDSEDFFHLGQLFYSGRWTEFFLTGPHREPLYPLLIAGAMWAGQWLGISYTYFLKIFSFGFLLIAMICIQRVLGILKVNRWIQAATVLYTGFSPILINSALCMYSEIAAFPWLVAAVLWSIRYLEVLRGSERRLAPAFGLSLSLLAFTMVKGAGMVLTPLFFGWLLIEAWRQSNLKVTDFLRRHKIPILSLLLVFYLPLGAYQSLNYFFNKHFALTNRSTMALYGNLNLRADNGLSLKHVLSHLATVPVSYDLCGRLFATEECNRWSMSASDETYLKRQDALAQQNLSAAQKEKIFNQGIAHALFGHPLIQAVYLTQEGLKMFFWETSQGAFVVYPAWLEQLFNLPAVVLTMSLGIGVLGLVGYVAAALKLNNKTVRIIFVLTSLLLVTFSFVNILQRYAIMAGPLIILLTVSGFFAPKTAKDHSSPRPHPTVDS